MRIFKTRQHKYMVDFLNNKNNKKEGLPEIKSRETSEKIIKEWFPVGKEGKEILERKELTETEKEEREKLKEEIEKIKLPASTEMDVLKKAEKMQGQTIQRKISNLLDLAQTKGISFAIKIAKETKDPYLIDLFHDILVKEGMYKKFTM